MDARRFAIVGALLLAAWLVHFALLPYAWDLSSGWVRLREGVGVLVPYRWVGRVLSMSVLGVLVAIGTTGKNRWMLALFGFCIALEVTQSFVRYRHPRGIDVLISLATSALGFSLARALRDSLDRWSVHLARGCALAVVAVACWWTFDGLTRTGLSNWDPSYRLAVRNELTWDRPWRGEILELAIYRRALDAEEVEKFARLPLHDDAGAPSRRESGAIGAWSLARASESTNESTIEDLLGVNDLHAEETRRIDEPRHIATAGPVQDLVAAMTRFSAFSIELRCRSDGPQFGPARIVTISKDPHLRNVTLSQDGDALNARVRSVENGLNGNRNEATWPGVFAARDAQHLVFTYERGEIRLFRNSLEAPRPLLDHPSIDAAVWMTIDPGVPWFLIFASLAGAVWVGWARPSPGGEAPNVL